MMIEKFLTILVLMFIGVTKCEEDYIDPVIDMLLNGVSAEVTDAEEENKNDGSVVFGGGIWKCGNCTDLGQAEIVYSEVNQVDADIDTTDAVDVQISLSLEQMRCVTLAADHPGTVRKVLGACDGSSVTLSVSPSNNFTILVYK